MRVLLCLAILSGFPLKANAETYKYYYEGPTLNVGFGPNPDFALGRSYEASLVIDEDLLGESLENASFAFEVKSESSFPLSYPDLDLRPVQGIVGFSWRYGLGSSGFTDPTDIRTPCCAGLLSINTDNSGNIVEGWFSFLDGPPDGEFGYGGDSLYISSGALSRTSGVWRTISPVPLHAIPLPTGLPLLLIGLAGFAVLRTRR